MPMTPSFNYVRTTRSRWTVFLSVALVALGATSPACAATRLRVTPAGGPPVSGTFSGLRGNALLLTNRNDASTQTIPLESIAMLERSTGVHGHSLAGAGIGLGVGALVGALLGASWRYEGWRPMPVHDLQVLTGYRDGEPELVVVTRL